MLDVRVLLHFFSCVLPPDEVVAERLHFDGEHLDFLL